jgi:hypothetical protein
VNGGRYRQSVQIGRKPAANLHHATRLAERVGYPLNQFVTINYSKTTARPEEASAHFRVLLASWFARWLRRHPKNRKACPPTYVWAFEAAGSQIAVHWLVHIPRGLIREFWRMVPLWVEITTGGAIGASTVRHKRIYNITGMKRYVLKGMDPHFARAWKIKAVPQGTVTGKRSGFSRNLGPVARNMANYRPQRYQAGQWAAPPVE